jgi:polysaccharide pyruvyl transferase WcaK-like protein
MKVINVLHVASFSGNIGDNANHSGFRSKFGKKLDGFEINYIEYEIRDTFWGDKKFDVQFVDLANQADLVVVGGGNYFELWVEKSRTGCSIDIELDDLSKIKTPIIFNALGVDPAQGASEIALTRFKIFLDKIIESPNMKLSCRNDGSFEALSEIVGGKYSNFFYHVPDTGLYTEVQDVFYPELGEEKKNVLIQVAGDMLDLRFSCQTDNGIEYAEFVKSMASTIEELVKNVGANVILCPHIFKDFTVINNILDEVDDKVRRTAVKVAPYLIGDAGQQYIFGLYAKCDLVIAMRFHANLCAMGLKVPTIALVNYRQIEKLYQEMNVIENAVVCNEQGFEDKLKKISVNHLTGEHKLKMPSLEIWDRKIDKFHSDMAKWVKDYFSHNNV